MGFKQLGEKSPTRQPFHSLGCRRHVYDLSGRRSSIRLERLTEGIQFFEKVRILKEEFEEKGNKGAIKNIDKTLKMFDESSMDKISPTTAVNKAKKVINRY